MNYYKELTTGAVVMRETAPVGRWWRPATAREYREYRLRVLRLTGNLDKAVAYKARLLATKP